MTIQLGGYDFTATPASETNAGNTAPGGNFIDLSYVLPNCSITKFKYYSKQVNGSGATVRVNIWRYIEEDEEYKLIAVSESLDLNGKGIGLHEFTLATPIVIQEGDYLGCWLSNRVGAAPSVGVDLSGGGYGYLRVNDTALNGTDDFSTWTLTAWKLGIAVFGTLLNKNGATTPFDIVGVGDSIIAGRTGYKGPENGGISGNANSQLFPYLVEALGGGLDYYNAGVGSETSFDVKDRLQALLDLYSPTYVYVLVGVNDIYFGSALADYIANMDEMLAMIANANAEMIVGEILPWQIEQATDVMTWNARLEKWCIDNDVKLGPTFQAMVDPVLADDLTINDDLEVGDAIHPNVAGYTLLGQLFAKAQVPSYKRTWGSSSYNLFGHESWDFCVKSGGVTSIGNIDTGTIVLPENETIDTPVKCIYHNGEAISISAREVSGQANIYYRTNDEAFKKNDGTIAWIPYSEPFTTTDQFIQIRLEGGSSTNTNISDLTLDWTETFSASTGPSIAEGIPESITAGLTTKWTDYFSDFKPEDGWSLNYYFVKSGTQIHITATDNGDSNHLISLSASTTAGYSPGTYDYKAIMIRASEKYEVAEGKITIEADFISSTSGLDNRTYNQRVRDALEAMMEGRATRVDEEYSINGRSLKRLSPEEIIMALEKFRGYCKQEEREANLKKGIRSSNKVYVRFGR